MNTTVIVTTLVVLVGVVLITLLGIVYVKNSTLESIRADVYQGFLAAEHAFKSGNGEKKMAIVYEYARGLLPNWAKPFITEAVLKKVLQCWFDAVKDLLDDGKVNKSSKEKKTEEE